MPVCKKGYYIGQVQNGSFLCEDCEERCFPLSKRKKRRRGRKLNLLPDVAESEFPLEDTYLDEPIEVTRNLKVRKRSKWQQRKEVKKPGRPLPPKGNWLDDHLW